MTFDRQPTLCFAKEISETLDETSFHETLRAEAKARLQVEARRHADQAVRARAVEGASASSVRPGDEARLGTGSANS